MFSIHKKETVPMPKRGPNRLRAEQEKEHREEKERAERLEESREAEKALAEVKAGGEAARRSQKEREENLTHETNDSADNASEELLHSASRLSVADKTAFERSEQPTSPSSPITSEQSSDNKTKNATQDTTPDRAQIDVPSQSDVLSGHTHTEEKQPHATDTENLDTEQVQHKDSEARVSPLQSQVIVDKDHPASSGSHASASSKKKKENVSRNIFNSAHRQSATSHQDAIALFAQGSRDNVATDTVSYSAEDHSSEDTSSKDTKGHEQATTDARNTGDTRSGIDMQRSDNTPHNGDAQNGADTQGASDTQRSIDVPDQIAGKHVHTRINQNSAHTHETNGQASSVSDASDKGTSESLHQKTLHTPPHITTTQIQPVVTHFGDGFTDASARKRPFDRDMLPMSGASEPDVRASTVFLDAFFSELVRCGVTEAVVSDGDLCHSLNVKALEYFGDVYAIDDERSAAYFALGLAKTTANPVVVICDGNASMANWAPAMLEASADYVPLIFISANRPSFDGRAETFINAHAQMLRNLAKHSMVMPTLPSKEASEDIARQKALEACVQAHGLIPGARACSGGPVYIQFKLKETMGVSMRSSKISESSLPPTVVAGQGFVDRNAQGLFSILHRVRVVAICGEGTCSSPTDADSLVEFAHRCHVPLLADALSGLRNIDDPMIIDAYHEVLESNSVSDPDVIIQMGQRPVSEEACRLLRTTNAFRIVVGMTGSPLGTSREIFVRSTPVVFAETMSGIQSNDAADEAYAKAWQEANREQRINIHTVRERDDIDDLEMGYADTLARLIPDESTLFCGAGAPMHMMDEVLERGEHRLDVLSNHGLDGNTGTLATAFGAAQCAQYTTVFLDANQFADDMNALQIQLEMNARANRDQRNVPSIVVVCLDRDNRSKPLPIVPHTDSGRMQDAGACIDFKHICLGMGAAYRRISNNHELRRVYPLFAHDEGIHVIDIRLPKNPPLF